MSTVEFQSGSQLVIEPDWNHRGWRKSDLSSTPGGAITASTILPAAGNVKALCGWALAETTGTTGATVRIHDGQSASVQVFARINLSSNESVRDTLGPRGIVCTTGELYIEILAGSVEGVIFWR